jgi:hypothetical protein
LTRACSCSGVEQRADWFVQERQPLGEFGEAAARTGETNGAPLLVDELLHALERHAQELACVTSPDAFGLELASCQS